MRLMVQLFTVLVLTAGLTIAEVSAQCSSCTVTLGSGSPNYPWQTSGTYCIPAGNTYSGTIVIASGATLNICGKLTGSLTIQGGTLNNNGIIATNSFTVYTGTLNNYDSIYYTGSQFTMNSATFNNYGKFTATQDLQVTAGTWTQNGTSLRVGGKLDVTNNSTMTIAAANLVTAGSLDVNTYSLTNNATLKVAGNVKVGSGGTLTNNKTLTIGGDLDNNANFKSTDFVSVAGATKNNTGTFEVSGVINTAYIYNNATFIADGTNIKIDSLLSNTSGTFTMKNGGKLETRNLENYGTINSSGSGVPVIKVTGTSVNGGTLTGNVDFCDYSGGMGTPDNNGGNTGGSVTFCNSSPLPVTWEEFSARWVQPNNGLLNWTTSQEVDNHHFDIMRSSDGKNWTKIGEVAGNGTSSQKSRYIFTDEYLPFNANVFYYRIKQVDIDGRFEYSNTVRMQKGAQSAELISFSNPASNGQLHINIKAPVKGQVTVKVMDLAGRELVNQSTNGAQALGSYSFELSHLPAGIYSFRIEGNGELLISEKLMIQ